ncbi:MAG: DUF1549 domain-containing protein, partial [Planctomycetales bacterium]|nr:DUF1549 domain-containing protein [Planctomycetales bacterium]
MRILALSRRCLSIVVWLSTLSAATMLSANEPAEPLTFERDIRPILKAHCLDCHGAEAEPKGGLDLRLARFMLSGGDSGAAIVAGQPAGSLLIERVESGEMPPGEKKMSAAELSTIRLWIEQGAKTSRPEPEKLDPGIGITPEEREFWSFQPIARPAVPDVKDGAVRTPIDSFIAERLEQRGLTLSADADRLTLLRRAYFDLTGLPPTRDEVAAFLDDESANAYERLIERLLESPHYGERWGRHWLDAAGYADSEGYTNNDAV